MGEDAKFFSILIIAFLIIFSFMFFQKMYEKKLEHECFISSGKFDGLVNHQAPVSHFVSDGTNHGMTLEILNKTINWLSLQ